MVPFGELERTEEEAVVAYFKALEKLSKITKILITCPLTLNHRVARAHAPIFIKLKGNSSKISTHKLDI